MPRGVLIVSGMEFGGKRLNTCMIEEAFGAPVRGGTFPLDCTASDPEFASLRSTPPQVQSAGDKLYRALVKHEALNDLFKLTKGGTGPYPLYIRVDTPDAEELPWETLWENQFFLLDQNGRWPIARQATVGKQSEPIKRFVSDHLRVAVVLAAARESGKDQWAKISAAVSDFQTPIDLLALVSEDETRDAIQADAAQWAGTTPARNVQVSFTGDTTALLNQLRMHAPNVVHFFCHGVADVRPQLEVETRADRKLKKESGSLSLGSNLLLELAQMKSLWLVALNCCQGAKSGPQLHSLARDLIAGGVPAVVAMRESVDVNDAHLFAEHFYAGLLGQLAATVFNGKNTRPGPLPFSELIWTGAVHAARRELSQSRARRPESSAQWTYPVVYVHRDGLLLYLRKLKPTTLSPNEKLALFAELDMLRAIRQTLDGDIDPEAPAKKAELDVRIGEIETQLSGQ